jgi:hypothetical protein
MIASATLLADADRAALAERFAARVRFDAPLAPATWWKIGVSSTASASARAAANSGAR